MAKIDNHCTSLPDIVSDQVSRSGDSYLDHRLSVLMENLYELSHVMRKPVYAICEQQRYSLISTFIVNCLDSIISLVSISENSSLSLAAVAGQASLCLTWSQTLKTGFLVTRLN